MIFCDSAEAVELIPQSDVPSGETVEIAAFWLIVPVALGIAGVGLVAFVVAVTLFVIK